MNCHGYPPFESCVEFRGLMDILKDRFPLTLQGCSFSTIDEHRGEQLIDVPREIKSTGWVSAFMNNVYAVSIVPILVC